MSETITTPEIGTTAHVPIGDIIVDPNIRKNVKVPKTFAASVKQHGVLQPVDAYLHPETGKWHLQDGQLRYLAALDAGKETLFVLVGDPALAEVRRIEKQLILNEQRNELTPADLAGAHQTLFDLGVGAEQISRRTDTPKKLVDQLLAVAKSPVLEKVDEGSITLEQGAAIAEFEGDADAVDQLTAAAIFTPASFDHEVARLRSDRVQATMKEELEKSLAEAGILVIDEPYWSDRYTLVEIESLYLDAELTEPLSSDSTKIPEREIEGLCAYVTSDRLDDGPDAFTWIAVYCVGDWAQHGFFAGPDYYASTEPPKTDETKPAAAKSEEPTADQLAATEERRRVIANNKAWPVARIVRIQWIVEQLLTRKKMPAGAQLLIAQRQAGLLPRDGYGGGLGTALEWLGVKRGGWSQDEVEKLLAKPSTDPETFNVAIALASAEEQLTPKDSWRHYEIKKLALYLATLQAWGYGLSELEQTIVTDNIAAGE